MKTIVKTWSFERGQTQSLSNVELSQSKLRFVKVEYVKQNASNALIQNPKRQPDRQREHIKEFPFQTKIPKKMRKAVKNYTIEYKQANQTTKPPRIACFSNTIRNEARQQMRKLSTSFPF